MGTTTAPNTTDMTSSLGVAVLTVSDTRTEATDTSGTWLAQAAAGAGHMLIDQRLVRDDIYTIRAVVSGWIIHPRVQVIITTGGTGFSERDTTPEALQPLFDREIVGFGEYFRTLSIADVGASTIQSRAVAGFANGVVIFALPGSTNACRTAWTQVIAAQLDVSHKPCNFVANLKSTRLCGDDKSGGDGVGAMDVDLKDSRVSVSPVS